MLFDVSDYPVSFDLSCSREFYLGVDEFRFLCLFFSLFPLIYSSFFLSLSRLLFLFLLLSLSLSIFLIYTHLYLTLNYNNVLIILIIIYTIFRESR